MKITEDTTYDEIANHLIKTDAEGVSDLIYLLFMKRPKLIQEVMSWPIVKEIMKEGEGA